MTMTINLFCAQCSNWVIIELADTDFKPGTTIEDIVTKHGWVAQENGEHCDLYCSQKCAQ